MATLSAYNLPTPGDLNTGTYPFVLLDRSANNDYRQVPTFVRFDALVGTNISIGFDDSNPRIGRLDATVIVVDESTGRVVDRRSNIPGAGSANFNLTVRSGPHTLCVYGCNPIIRTNVTSGSPPWTIITDPNDGRAHPLDVSPSPAELAALVKPGSIDTTTFRGRSEQVKAVRGGAHIVLNQDLATGGITGYTPPVGIGGNPRWDDLWIYLATAVAGWTIDDAGNPIHDTHTANLVALLKYTSNQRYWTNFYADIPWNTQQDGTNSGTYPGQEVHLRSDNLLLARETFRLWASLDASEQDDLMEAMAQKADAIGSMWGNLSTRNQNGTSIPQLVWMGRLWELHRVGEADEQWYNDIAKRAISVFIDSTESARRGVFEPPIPGVPGEGQYAPEAGGPENTYHGITWRILNAMLVAMGADPSWSSTRTAVESFADDTFKFFYKFVMRDARNRLVASGDFGHRQAPNVLKHQHGTAQEILKTSTHYASFRQSDLSQQNAGSPTLVFVGHADDATETPADASPATLFTQTTATDKGIGGDGNFRFVNDTYSLVIWAEDRTGGSGPTWSGTKVDGPGELWQPAPQAQEDEGGDLFAYNQTTNIGTSGLPIAQGGISALAWDDGTGNKIAAMVTSNLSPLQADCVYAVSKTSGLRVCTNETIRSFAWDDETDTLTVTFRLHGIDHDFTRTVTCNADSIDVTIDVPAEAADSDLDFFANVPFYRPTSVWGPRIAVAVGGTPTPHDDVIGSGFDGGIIGRWTLPVTPGTPLSYTISGQANPVEPTATSTETDEMYLGLPNSVWELGVQGKSDDLSVIQLAVQNTSPNNYGLGQLAPPASTFTSRRSQAKLRAVRAFHVPAQLNYTGRLFIPLTCLGNGSATTAYSSGYELSYDPVSHQLCFWAWGNNADADYDAATVGRVGYYCDIGDFVGQDIHIRLEFDPAQVAAPPSTAAYKLFINDVDVSASVVAEALGHATFSWSDIWGGDNYIGASLDSAGRSVVGSTNGSNLYTLIDLANRGGGLLRDAISTFYFAMSSVETADDKSVVADLITYYAADTWAPQGTDFDDVTPQWEINLDEGDGNPIDKAGNLGSGTNLLQLRNNPQRISDFAGGLQYVGERTLRWEKPTKHEAVVETVVAPEGFVPPAQGAPSKVHAAQKGVAAILENAGHAGRLYYRVKDAANGYTSDWQGGHLIDALPGVIDRKMVFTLGQRLSR